MKKVRGRYLSKMSTERFLRSVTLVLNGEAMYEMFTWKNKLPKGVAIYLYPPRNNYESVTKKQGELF